MSIKTDMKWTKNQQAAIDAPRSDILVSAAAGSGKTATLTERVLRALTGENPTDITRMLIVTFTNKAAAELKEKIRKKLTEAFAAQPDNLALRKSLIGLQSASICTIHSFYGDVVRTDFNLLGISPRMRTAEPAEIFVLKRDIMEKVIDGYYEGVTEAGYEIENAEDFFDNFLSVKPDSSLPDLFMEIYNSLSSYAERVEYLKKNAEIFTAASKDFIHSGYFEQLLKTSARKTSALIAEFERFSADFSADEAYTAQTANAVNERIDFLRLVRENLCVEHYKNIPELFGCTSFPNRKGGSPELINRFNRLLTKTREYKAYINDTLFAFNSADVSALASQSADICEKLYRLLSYFDKAFSEEKQQRRIIDFDDMERFTYKLICSPDGSVTPAASRLREKYDEIYIDEYQDVNEIQDSIFAAISKNNRFMVGDVKQSIYGFRGSRPELFSSYREKFKDGTIGKTIFLSDNFRCGEPVVDFVNLIFGDIFTRDGGTLKYDPCDALVFSKSAEVYENAPVRVTVSPDRDSELDAIAFEIRRLLENGTDDSGKRLQPQDITVLFHTAKECRKAERRLLQLDIPAFNTARENLFNSPEVLLVIGILSAIDNPLRDITLAAAMKSPVFGFTLDDLAKIRLFDRENPLYTAVKNYTEQYKDEKCAAFLSRLDGYRKRSRTASSSRFIRYLYRDTGILSLIYNPADGDGADLRYANLMMLYDFARTFEEGSFKGLHAFITHINDLIRRNKQFPCADAGADAGRIRIMTMHASKGLEFPACIVAGTSHSFSDLYLRSPMTLDSDMGLAVKLKVPDGRICKGPLYKSVVCHISEQDIREEARLFYVALTRAKKYLVVSAVGEKSDFEKGGGDILSCGSCADFLKVTLSPDNFSGFYYYNPETQKPSTEVQSSVQALDEAAIAGYEAEYNRRFSFEYPDAELTDIPRKVSVSHLSPSFLDETEPSLQLNTDAPQQPELPLMPSFMDPLRQVSSISAERGTATHLFMQFCDFSSAEKSAENEAERMVLEGFIPQDAPSLMYKDELQKFFTSDLYLKIKDCLSHNRLFCREYRFNIGLPASYFTQSEQKSKTLSDKKLLVQGVIDCFFENADGTITLCDYKTDRIRNTPSDISAFILKHKTQLSYYVQAIERLTLKKVSGQILYSFCLGKEIAVQ